jgi:hypothetical protein
MLGSTFVLGLASGSKTLPLVTQDGYAAEYYLRESAKSYRVRVRHSNVTRNGVEYDRHNVEAVITVFASGAVAEYQETAYFITEQLASDSIVELMDALADWAIASSNANLTKLLGWES